MTDQAVDRAKGLVLEPLMPTAIPPRRRFALLADVATILVTPKLRTAGR